MRYLSKVDFQAHYLPPAYLDFLARHHPGEPDGYPTPDYWTMEWQREKMRLLDVPDTHLLYGSDTPYTPIEACLGQALALAGSGLITEAQKRKVFTGNALDVNPKLRTIPGLASAAGTPAAERKRIGTRRRVPGPARTHPRGHVGDGRRHDHHRRHRIRRYERHALPRVDHHVRQRVRASDRTGERHVVPDAAVQFAGSRPHLPFAPSRLTIDARIIFDSYASALPPQPGSGDRES